MSYVIAENSGRRKFRVRRWLLPVEEREEKDYDREHVFLRITSFTREPRPECHAEIIYSVWIQADDIRLHYSFFK